MKQIGRHEIWHSLSKKPNDCYFKKMLDPFCFLSHIILVMEFDVVYEICHTLDSDKNK